MPQLTLLATTDVHGYVLNWDYYRDRPWKFSDGSELGLAQAASVVARFRAERGAESVLLVDNGDSIQGTPLATYYARQAPISVTGQPHPMAAAYNVMGYDAGTLGNHEFNYGLDLLLAYRDQLAFPLLGANVVDLAGQPVLRPYTLIQRIIDDRPLNIGILGLTTPGAMIWDRDLLTGRIEVTDMVAAAAHWVPQLRAAGADVVVLLCHAGLGQTTYATTSTAPAENPAKELAEQVPGIDVMVIGHTHKDVPEQWISCEATGQQVLLTQPRPYAAGITETLIELNWDGERYQPHVRGARPHPVAGQTPDPIVVAAISAAHETTRAYVNQQIAVSDQKMATTDSCWRPTAAIDFIHQVQAATVRAALADGPHGNLPVVSLTAPTSRAAVVPAGAVSIRDLASLYIFDNTLAAVLLTGAELRRHLEHAARFYADLPRGVDFDPTTMAGVERDGLMVWDYQYDTAWGISYDIDLNQPVGERITRFTHLDGTPIRDDENFAVALNHYRRGGSGGYVDVAQAPVLYNDMVEIRQLLIDWASSHGMAVPEPSRWRLCWEGSVG